MVDGACCKGTGHAAVAILSKLSKLSPEISFISIRRTDNVAGDRREGRSRDEAQGEDDDSSDHG